MIEVRPLEAGEEEAWDLLLQRADGGLLYHSIAYRDLLVDHLGCDPEYLVAEREGEIVGVMPLMWSGEAEERVCNSLPFYGSHGGPVTVEAEADGSLIEAWNERAGRRSTVAATLVENPFRSGSLEGRPRHTVTDERISQVTELPAEPGETAILELIDSSARRNVRKAERHGFDVGRDHSALPELWRIHDANMEAMGGLAKPAEFFQAIPRHFAADESFDLWVARLDGEVAAALLVFYFGATAEYFTPAVEHEQRSNQPMSLILVRAMAHAGQRGVTRWNWGGTWGSQDGVYRFKRKWGAHDGRYRYYVQVNDESLLEATPGELRARFPHFYVAPFSTLKGDS